MSFYSSFSKKDYEAIAGIIAKSESAEGIIGCMSDLFVGDNPRFDEERFCKARIKRSQEEMLRLQ